MNAEEERYVRMFVNWLYTHGPDPNGITREKLITEYTYWLTTQPDLVRWDAWKESRLPNPA